MTNEEYFAIAVDVFPMPTNHGPSAAVVAGMATAVIAETTQLLNSSSPNCARAHTHRQARAL
jgi:hypothetical protein